MADAVGGVRNCLCSAKWRTGDDGGREGGRDQGWMEGRRDGCLLFAALARTPTLLAAPLESLSGVRVRSFFFARPKCKFMSRSSFFFSSSSLPKYRHPSASVYQTDEEDQMMMAMMRPAAPRPWLVPLRQMCGRHSVEISNAKTRIPPSKSSSRTQSEDDPLAEASSRGRNNTWWWNRWCS